jgi:hypothetical protein
MQPSQRLRTPPRCPSVEADSTARHVLATRPGRLLGEVFCLLANQLIRLIRGHAVVDELLAKSGYCPPDPVERWCETFLFHVDRAWRELSAHRLFARSSYMAKGTGGSSSCRSSPTGIPYPCAIL